jgi:hypothetical protein
VQVKSLKPIPLYETTGVAYARVGTVFWGFLATFSWLFQEFVRNDLLGGLKVLPEVSLAGFLLGLLGLLHVTRRARHIQVKNLDQSHLQ